MQDILLALKNKDESAYRKIFDEYKDRIYKIAYSFVYNKDDALDIVQNVFLKVFTGIDKFRGDSSLYTWIYRIAVNESISYLKKFRKKLHKSLDGVYDVGVHDNHDRNIAKMYIQKAIDRLPKRQKAVFSLRYFDNLSFKKIGEIIDISENNAKVNYFYALSNIKKYFKEVGYEL